jgi:hypothetical protein
VSNWPFSNGLRTPMYASFVQCSHKFSNSSYSKSVEPFNGTESESGNTGIVRSKVSRPLHRIFLTGIFYPTMLSKLAEVLCALSEVSHEGNGEEDRGVDIIETKEGGTVCAESGSNGSNSRSSSSSSSSSIDTTRKYSFDISTLQHFDNAFLHPKSLASAISDKKKDENYSEDLGPIIASIPAESARLPKIPMKFNSTIVDSLSSSIPYTVRSLGKVPRESSSSSSGVGRLSMGGLNVLSSAYSTDDDYRDSTDTSLTDDPNWVGSKRSLDRPYFIVRTASGPRMESFCHYLKTQLPIPKNRVHGPSGGSISGDTDNDSGSVIADNRDRECTGAVATMDSYLPITEIRWPATASSSFSSSSSSLSVSGTVQTEEKLSTKNRRVSLSLSQSDKGSTVSREYSAGVSTGLLSGRKRKQPHSTTEVNSDTVATSSSSSSSNIELNSYYDVVYGAKLPTLCLVQAKHSKEIVREKIESDNSGAVLNELNKYEIYVPETLEDRQRKRMTL